MGNPVPCDPNDPYYSQPSSSAGYNPYVGTNTKGNKVLGPAPPRTKTYTVKDSQGRNITYQGDNPDYAAYQQAQQQQKTKGYDWGGNLMGSFGGAFQAYFGALMQGASGADALRAGKQQLVQGLTGTITQGLTAGMGPAGALVGPLIGGLFGLGLTKLFGLDKQAVDHPKPTPVRITNVLDFLRMFTLPTSAYFAASGKNIGPVQIHQQNQFHMTGGPKIATRVLDALTGPGLAESLNAGFS